MVAEQAPPHNPETEATVIASILVDSEAISRVAAFLQPQHFFQERHVWMYEAALALWDRSESINPVTMAHELMRRRRLDEVGGHSYLSQIIVDLPTSVGVEYSAKIVQRDATYRRLIEAAGTIARIGYEGGPSLQDGLGRAESLLLALRGGERLRDFVSLRDLLESFLGPPSEEDERRLLDVARTGFSDLDSLLTGLKRSDVTVLAARPSAGKSALALSMARNLAIGQNGKVAFFSLEMSAGQLAARLVAGEAEVESQRLPWGRHTEAEEGRISRAIGVLSRAEIYIDETPGITIAELRAKARRLSHEVGLDMIVVDHMQLCARRHEHRDGYEPGRGDELHLSFLERVGARDRGASAGAVATLACSGGAPSARAVAERPARKRLHRAGCGRGGVHLPRGHVRAAGGMGGHAPGTAGVLSLRRGATNRGQASQWTNRHRASAVSQEHCQV